jgi:hypothetical protein
MTLLAKMPWSGSAPGEYCQICAECHEKITGGELHETITPPKKTYTRVVPEQKQKRRQN